MHAYKVEKEIRETWVETRGTMKVFTQSVADRGRIDSRLCIGKSLLMNREGELLSSSPRSISSRARFVS